MQSDRLSRWIDEQRSRFQEVYAKVYACERQVIAEGNKAQVYEGHLVKRVIQQELPTVQEQDDYDSWVIARFATGAMARRETPAPSVDHYRSIILNTNLVDEDAARELTMLLDRVPYPYIGIGRHKQQYYRLKPMTDLLTTQEEDIWWEDP